MTRDHLCQLSEPSEGKPEEVPIWLQRLEQIEFVNLAAYAASLPISMTLTWIFYTLGLVFWVASIIAQKIRGLKPASTLARAPLAIPLFILAGAITISGAFNGGSRAGELGPHSLLQAWNSIASLKSVLPYFWAFSLFRRNQTCAVTAVVLLLSASSMGGLWGTIQQLFNIHPGYKWMQGTGFLGHPMAFAGQMQLFSMLALGLFVAGGYKELAGYCPHPYLKWLFQLFQKTNVFAFIVVANLAGLFFAGERSAWLGGIAGVIAVTMLKSWRVALKALLSLTALAGISFVLFKELVRARIEVIFSGHDKSISARQEIWGQCLHHYFPQSPIFGIGLLNFPHFSSGVASEVIVPGVSKDLNHAHSNYIHILTATGIVGLASYILLLLWTFRAAITKFRDSSKAGDQLNAGIAMGIFGAAISLAISGIFEFNFGTAQVRLAQWFLFGLL